MSLVLKRSINSNWLERSGCFFVAVLLFLVIVFPTAFQPVKAVLLLLVFSLILYGAINGGTRLAGGLYVLSLFYAVIGLAWSAYGESLGNPGAVKVLGVMALYPLILPLLSVLYREDRAASLYKIFWVCAWVIALTDIAFVIAGVVDPNNILQNFFDWLYPDWAVVDNAETYLKFTLPNVSSVIFILPFFLTALFFSDQPKDKYKIFIIVALLMAVALLAGRRGLLLTMFIGPVLVYLLTVCRPHPRSAAKMDGRLWSIILLAAAAGTAYLFIGDNLQQLDYFVDMLSSIFDFKENESNLLRVYQYEALLRGIVDSPIFGQGAGAVADYVRSVEQPWAYELYYVALIFQYGILGFGLYVLGVLMICWHLISAINQKGRASFESYYFSGFVSFMLATGSNPYLAKFDFMWLIFIPYAMINSKILSRKLSCFVEPSRVN